MTLNADNGWMTGITKGKKLLADVGLFYSAAIWGSTFFIVKGALDNIDPVMMVAYRFLIAGVVLLPFLFYTKRNFFQNFKQGLVLSVILWLLYIPQTIGLEYTTASNSGFITGLFVLFVPIFQLTIFRRKPNLLEVIAACVSLGGLWILTGGLYDVNIGDILTLLAAVTYALHVLFSDKYIKSGADPFILSCQQFIFIGVFSLITGLVFDLPFTTGNLSVWWIILFLALFPTLSAFIIQLLAQKITAPLKVSLIFALEPVFAAVFAWTLGGETPILHRALGGLLIFLALIISGLPRQKLTKIRRTHG
ncbi:MAG: DMT family transporter [candidate division Zixibacteria bacterium]|nr:DMT family transporter [candidate division Zixibacteria bacterium]